MQGPFRHYVLNVLWIFINVLCVCLTMYHLWKLYKDLSQSNLASQYRVAIQVAPWVLLTSKESLRFSICSLY